MDRILERRCVVFMSDFGLSDGAVSAMHGVVDSVDQTLKIEDLTHEIPQFNIWEASYRLIQALTYWAPGTVFVCVVDPGVGSDRKSVVVKTTSGHYIVTPDNGTLTHVFRDIGIVERREIAESINRLAGSDQSYTFQGRDVYAYTGARLASGKISFEEVGPKLDLEVVQLDVQQPILEDGVLCGAIDILDTRYGSLWSNIPLALVKQARISYGDVLDLEIRFRGRIVYGYQVKFLKSFANAAVGEALIYLNSLLKLGIAINQGNFASKYNIGTGEGWKITLSKI